MKKVVLCPNPYRDHELKAAKQAKEILDSIGFETAVCLPFQREGYGEELGMPIKQLYQEIKGGYTTKMSFGFRVRKSERTVEEDEELGSITVHRKITEIEKLYDVSAVSLPANDATEISARNLCDGLIAEVKEERLADEERKRKKNQIAIMAEMI